MAKRSNYPSKKLLAISKAAQQAKGNPSVPAQPTKQARQVAELKREIENLNNLVDTQEKVIDRLEKKIAEIESKLKVQEEAVGKDAYRKQLEEIMDQMRKKNPQPPLKPYPNPWMEPHIGDRPNPWGDQPYTPWISYNTNQSQMDRINKAFHRTLESNVCGEALIPDQTC